MQGITDLRKQAAANAMGSLGLTTRYDRVWATQVAGIAREVGNQREHFDTRNPVYLHDLNPGSSTFGEWTGVGENPYNRGPI